MTFKPYYDPTHLYFITATVLGWKQLFIQPDYARIILDSLDWHRKNSRWNLYAYVVMPSHLHTIIKPLDNRSISRILQSYGSFTAHAVLDRLQNDQRYDLLDFFAQRQDRDASKQHQIWQPIQAKNISSIPFLQEKLEYIHNNPIAKKWHLVEDRADYTYSSAGYYDRGLTPPVEVDDIREWLS